MFLIWGWRSLLKVLGVGEFQCPRCQVDRSYRLVRPRRWFTVFFIPVIPLKWGEPFVECDACKGTYREQVLSAPTNKQFAYMLALGARAMYAKAVAAGFRHSERMIDRAVARLLPVVGGAYTAANLVADVEAFGDQELVQYLAPVAASMSPQGRETLVGGLVEFVHEDGPAPAEVSSVVSEAAAALELSAAHLAGIVSSVTSAQQGQS